MNLIASQEEMVPLLLTSGVGAKVERGRSWVGRTALGAQPPPPLVPHLPSADRSRLCHLSSPNTAQCLAPVSYPDGGL